MNSSINQVREIVRPSIETMFDSDSDTDSELDDDEDWVDVVVDDDVAVDVKQLMEQHELTIEQAIAISEELDPYIKSCKLEKLISEREKNKRLEFEKQRRLNAEQCKQLQRADWIANRKSLAKPRLFKKTRKRKSLLKKKKPPPPIVSEYTSNTLF